MSFLSFYNDHHGKGNEAILNLIEKQQWEEAEFAARTDPLAIHWKVVMPRFFDGQVGAKVLPIHIACQKKCPPNIVRTMYDIHPRGILTQESTYRRLPLHIACMYHAPQETIIELVSLKKGACKKKDAFGRLPLHYACKDPSYDTAILAMLKAYPGATKVADKNGFLPIHVACRFGMSPAVISMLLRESPSSCNKKTSKGSTPYMCAKQMEEFEHKGAVMKILKNWDGAKDRWIRKN